MAFLSTPIALVLSFAFLGALLYKRVNLGITLTSTALFFSVLALDLVEISTVIIRTATDPLTIAVGLATFAIMWLSQLYKETGLIRELSGSLGGLIRNPKIVLSLLPAVIGFLPVAGGALMSAPLVDSEAEKLKMSPDRKAYVNLWFRHTIFPVYPISQPLILATALTLVAMPLIIVRQIPVVIAMVIVGFAIGFWKVSQPQRSEGKTEVAKDSHLRDFLVSFSPVLVTIVVALTLDLVFAEAPKTGLDVVLATFAGLGLLLAISKPSLSVTVKPLRSWAIYGITLAALGAFLLRNSMEAAGISEIFQAFVTNGTVDVIVLLTVVPAVLGLITGSPAGGIAISVSILSGILAGFTPKTAALVYISAYLGYTVAPTHLCFQFTADYFKCSLGRMYRYVVPSFLVAFAMALLVYFLF